MYCIAGNIGGQLNLAVWPQISIAKNLNIGGFINLVVWYRVVYASMKYNCQIFSLYGIATARVLYCFSPNECIVHALALSLSLSLFLSLIAHSHRPRGLPLLIWSITRNCSERARSRYSECCLWPHQSFWQPHQRNKGVEGMYIVWGGAHYAERAWRRTPVYVHKSS